MATTTEERPVAKKKPKAEHGGKRPGAGRPPEGRDDTVVRVDRAVVMKAGAVARHLGMSVAQLMTDAARPTIDRLYAKMLRELDESAK